MRVSSSGFVVSAANSVSMLFSASQGIVALAVLLEERLALVACERKPSVARREQFKKPRLRSRIRCVFRSKEGVPGAASAASDRIPRQFLKPVIRNLSPEIIAGHVFHLVRFIEHTAEYSGRMLPKSSCLRRDLQKTDDDSR